MEQICDAVLEICKQTPDVQFVYPVHLNPAVRETVFAKLADHPQIHLIDPLDVQDMHNAMARSFFVMTAKVVGVETNEITEQALKLLNCPESYREMATAKNPYGDGNASRRIAAILREEFSEGKSNKGCAQ